MSDIALLSAFDGAATPVQHDFLPISVTDDAGEVVALYRESLSNVPLYGQPTVEVRNSPRSKAGIYRCRVQVKLPVMESVTNQNAAGYTAAPKVAHVVTCNVELLSHERCDATTRRIARGLAANIINGKTTTTAIITTGPGPEALDQVIAPT